MSDEVGNRFHWNIKTNWF